MKNTYKYLFATLVMAVVLIYGLHIGHNTALALHDQDEPNGWVCPQEPDKPENQGVCLIVISNTNWSA